MGILNQLGIVSGKDNKAAERFESIFENFLKVEYKYPSDYIIKYWDGHTKLGLDNSNINGKVFEYILATLFIREGILPLYLNAKVAFVPNVIYDLMSYSSERGPICFSAKTSLRERYKQADLEAIALKYVHRKALCYLITLGEREANSVKEKIKTGDVIGLDDVIIASSSELDNMISEVKKYNLITPGSIEIIKSNQAISTNALEKIK